MPPLPYPTNPNLPQSAYPDVTAIANNRLKQIEQEAEETDIISAMVFLWSNFNNNRKWDMQVGHGLPGQILERKKEKILRDPNDPDHVKTIDQKALFNDEVQDAGYISNFVFGFGAAAWQVPLEYAKNGAHGGALIDDFRHLRFRRLFPDNPRDQKAIENGYKAYEGTINGSRYLPDGDRK